MSARGGIAGMVLAWWYRAADAYRRVRAALHPSPTYRAAWFFCALPTEQQERSLRAWRATLDATRRMLEQAGCLRLDEPPEGTDDVRP